jgi:hypothetical protein
MLLLHLLFWVLVLLDAGLILLFLVLGLAAAKPSGTSMLEVGWYMLLLPGAALLGAIVLFLAGKTALLRSAAILIAAAPFLYLGGMALMGQMEMAAHSDGKGGFSRFQRGAGQELEAAIRAGDVQMVKSIAARTNLKELGTDGSTVLGVAMEQIAEKGAGTEVMQALLKAGADPNAQQSQMPLGSALAWSGKIGLDPARILLDAGANPNARSEFGDPVYFMAGAAQAHPEAMELVIARGADVRLRSTRGTSALVSAAQTQNYKALFTLLQHGADWREAKDLNGRDLPALLRHLRDLYGDKPGLAEALAFMER